MARKMRDSGVEWIGEVPEGWEMKYLSQSVSQVKNRNDGLKEKNLLSLSYGKIKRKDIDSIGGLLPASFEGYNIIAPNDIVLRLTDLQNDQHSLRVGLSHENGIVTSAYTTIRPCDRINAVYLFYSLFAFDIAKGFYGMGAGVRQGLNYDEVKQIKLLSPPLHEQRRIADYLDEKCAAIDGAVGELKRGIEDCKAWKKAIIFEAVTGKKRVTGNGERGMGRVRDSGIPWIGEIPEGWEVRRLKDVANIQTGTTPDKKYQNEFYSSESGVPWIKAENLGRMSPILTTAEYLTPAGEIQGRVFPEKSVYVCCIASIGKVGYSEIRASCNQQINALVFKKPVYWKFGFYVTTASEEEYLIKASGNVVKILNSTEQGLIAFPFPSLPEQQAIANYLDEKCAAIDALVAEKEKLIADLEAYKKSLIFELVTGKKR